MKKNNKLLVANWKMGPETPELASEIFNLIKKQISRTKRVEVVICSPYLYIQNLAKRTVGLRRLAVGSQDIFWETGKPTFTGQVNVPMVLASGAKYTIVGHSERRQYGETDTMVNEKVKSALKFGLTPILCVGEKERDPQINYLEFLRNQIKQSLLGVKKAGLANLVIAYEPVWAIGPLAKGAIQPNDLREMVIFVRKAISDLYDRETAMSLRILYGGSVDEENAEAFLREGEVDGLLVGRSSLNPATFRSLIKITDSFK